jgi:CII-binding regulator of phage lambda lysogenization HflD
MELTRYVIALLRHERNLAGKRRHAREVGGASAAPPTRRGDLPLLDREVLAGLAGIYQDTISKLDAAHHRPRQPALPARIRTTRTASAPCCSPASAPRCSGAQCGGSRWQVLPKPNGPRCLPTGDTISNLPSR